MLRGTDETRPIDFAFDGSVHMVGERERFVFAYRRYSWEGTARWTSIPSTWLIATHSILTGYTVRGVGVTRAGNAADGYRYGGWIGTTTAGGGAELGVELETVEPIRYDATSMCYQPAAGRLVLHGAVDVEIRCAAGPSCAMPTWTRAGVPMGPITLPSWSYFMSMNCDAGS
ncbi:MAG: hypothetical protein IPN17_19720 [Deltaproteobacteria bacterium]|nr:hypothetical protein [Deltaproteobacteria bacterium]MBK8694445.1 hypothetical protein [Deltaproteobacteria bacterium]